MVILPRRLPGPNRPDSDMRQSFRSGKKTQEPVPERGIQVTYRVSCFGLD